MRARLVDLLALILVLSPIAVAAEKTQTLTLSPEQVVGLIAKGQKVSLILKTGTHAEGRVEAVEAERLRVNIRRSDNPRDLPKGAQDLAWERLASVTVSLYKSANRIVLPFILSVTLGPLAVAAGGLREVPNAFGPAVLVGVALAGYYAGRAADRQTITIIIK